MTALQGICKRLQGTPVTVLWVCCGRRGALVVSQGVHIKYPLQDLQNLTHMNRLNPPLPSYAKTRTNASRAAKSRSPAMQRAYNGCISADGRFASEWCRACLPCIVFPTVQILPVNGPSSDLLRYYNVGNPRPPCPVPEHGKLQSKRRNQAQGSRRLIAWQCLLSSTAFKGKGAASTRTCSRRTVPRRAHEAKQSPRRMC